MSYLTLDNIEYLIVFSIMPGCIGGLTLFLWGVKHGHYKNNKYFAKFLIEILGAMITASVVSSLFPLHNYKPFVAFSIGIAWSKIIQTLRNRITKLVIALIGDIEVGGNK